MRHISITPVLGVGITDLRPVLDDEVYIQRDYPDGEADQVRMTIAEAFQVRDALAHLLVDTDQQTTTPGPYLQRARRCLSCRSLHYCPFGQSLYRCDACGAEW